MAKILYACCEQTSYELLTFELATIHCEIDWVRTTREALNAAAENSYDLYLLDNWWIGDGTGLDLCRSLRSLDAWTPILFYSANVFPSEIEKALAAGAQGYVTMPDIDRMLLDRIRRLLVACQCRNAEARLEEVQAVVESIREKYRKASHSLSEAACALIEAEAKLAFVRAGGTSAHFKRIWPDVLKEAIAVA